MIRGAWACQSGVAGGPGAAGRTALLGAALALAPALMAGCGEASAQDVIDVALADLPAGAGTDMGVFQSAPWTGPYLRYPGKTALRVEHDLGRVPRVVLPYVAFQEDGRDAALAAGDLARIEEVTDMTVTLRNGTEQTFYLRLVLQ